jgi:hypothetical protein
MQPADDITTPTGLLGGALYQRTVQRVRQFSLAGQFSATTFAQLQRLRAELHAALTPFTRGRAAAARAALQPIEGRAGDWRGAGDRLPLHRRPGGQHRQPVWRARGDPVQHVSAADPERRRRWRGAGRDPEHRGCRLHRRAAGEWRLAALAGGLGGGGSIHVSAAVYGPDGNLYVGGHFTTAYNAAGTGSPVTVNNIAMWNGTSWAALGSGFNEEVAALAFDAAGNLYAGGYFSDAAYPYLAVWDGASVGARRQRGRWNRGGLRAGV